VLAARATLGQTVCRTLLENTPPPGDVIMGTRNKEMFHMLATLTYGTEFCAMRTAVEELIVVCYMLQCLGVKVLHASLICGDNLRVIQNCTIKDSLLKKVEE
jgi:hypothetical protein